MSGFVVACRFSFLFLGRRDRKCEYVADIHGVQGTNDAVYSVANAQREIKLFSGSLDAKVVPVEGGVHFLSASHPKEVGKAVLKFVEEYK